MIFLPFFGTDLNVLEFLYDQKTNKFTVTEGVKESFDNDGGIIVRNVLDTEEVQLILDALENNPILDQAWAVADDEGKAGRLLLWKHPGNDITGMVGRCEKVVSTSEKLLGDEVYHYHTKLMMKEARTGGKFVWHQDYGYWYNNGCLKPDMLTVFIPLDPCTKENGCLQVIPGSHKLGRVDHGLVGGQQGADQERMDMILTSEDFKPVFVQMEPGDALFFHCNLLHKSDKNNSDLRRWAFLTAYNTKSNNPVIEHECPFYTPLIKVDNNAIKTCKTPTDFTGKEIMNPKKDHNIKVNDG